MQRGVRNKAQICQIKEIKVRLSRKREKKNLQLLLDSKSKKEKQTDEIKFSSQAMLWLPS